MVGFATPFRNHTLRDDYYCGCRCDGPAHKDPLRFALNRGSEALEFVNKPLVQDYVELKFSCTLPYWTSRRISYPTVNKGFLKYCCQDTNRQDSGTVISDESSGSAEWDDLLLRYVVSRHLVHVLASAGKQDKTRTDL